MADRCSSLQPGNILLNSRCPDCGHSVSVHDERRMCSVCLAVEAMTITPEEFDLLCDMVEIVFTFGVLQPNRAPVAGSPAAVRIVEFSEMRKRRRGS